MAALARSSSQDFKVIIAGGGIVGLTLANALQHANIDYILIDRRKTVTPDVGATIAFFPNGSRILHQLGCYEPLWNHTVQVDRLHEYDENGKMFRSQQSDVFLWIARRTGFHVPLIDRHHILDLLYEKIWDKRKIITNKKIVNTTEDEDGVTVTCEDGTRFCGTVLAGTDGVHSFVRSEMWRIADEKISGFIPESDKHAMYAEYRCMFGITHPGEMPAPPGTEYVTYKKDISSITVFCKDGQIFFFLFQKLDRIYKQTELPRYTEADAEQFATDNADFPIGDEHESAGKVTFGDLWKRRKTHALVPLEEAQYAKWTFGRIVLLGDSVQKGTPNAGPGGNGGIESAAALANTLYKLRGRTETPTRDEVIAAFKGYQDKRKQRANAYLDSAKMFTQLQALYSWPHRLMTLYASSMWENATVEMFSDQCQNAPKVDYLPTPQRSLQGWMPFNEEQGDGVKEPVLLRVLRATIMLAVPMLISLFMPPIYDINTSSTFQNLARSIDFSPIYTIMLLESSRRLANSWTLAAIPTLVIFAGLRYSMAPVMAFYFFLHYVLSPIKLFRSSEVRLTDRKYSQMVFPTILMGFLAQYILSMLSPVDLGMNNMYPSALTPLLFSVIWHGLARTRKDTWFVDRSTNPRVDVPIVNWTMAMTIAVSTMSNVVFRLLAIPMAVPIMRVSGYDATSMCALLWLGLFYFDLKQAGMAKYRWISVIAAVIAGVVLIGTGPVIGLCWSGREWLLVNRRHKGAVVKDDHAEFKQRYGMRRSGQSSENGGMKVED